MAYSWVAHGLLFYYTWVTPVTWNLGCTSVSPVLHVGCTWGQDCTSVSSGLHVGYTFIVRGWVVRGLRLGSAWVAPGLGLGYANVASELAPNLHLGHNWVTCWSHRVLNVDTSSRQICVLVSLPHV